MGLIAEEAPWLVLAFAAGAAVNAVARRCLPGDMLDGSPRWCWLVAKLFQQVLCPLALLRAWAFEAFAPGWLVLPRAAAFEAAGGGARATRHVVRLLVGYFAKDLLEQQQALYHAHHVACIGMTVAALAVPCAGPAVLAGATVLECGSSTYGATVLYPSEGAMKRRALRRRAASPPARGFSEYLRNRAILRYVVGMTASNLVPAALFAYVVIFLECVPVGFKVTYTLILSVLLFMRQQEVWLRPYGPSTPPKPASKAT